MGHWSCFSFNFLTLKGKIGKLWKSRREIIIWAFSTYFLLHPSQKSSSKYVLDLSYQKITIFSEKRPFKFNSGFNNQQNLMIFGLLIVDKNQKMFWKLHPWFSPQILPFFHSKMAKFGKSQFFEILESQNCRNGEINWK